MGDNPQKEMKQLFQSGLRKLNIPLDGIALEKLLLYAGELEKWSRRINLIARKTTTRDVVEKHFLDSLTLLPFVVGKDNLPSATLLDVGTGAGFPGLVLAVALPDLQVILVEPRLKRVSFLRHIIRTLSLANVEIIDQRLESAPGLQEKKIDYVTSRACSCLAQTTLHSGKETVHYGNCSWKKAEILSCRFPGPNAPYVSLGIRNKVYVLKPFSV